MDHEPIPPERSQHQRVRKPGKLVDGSGLFFQRNKDGTLTPWQRVRLPGSKDRDVKVGPPHLDDVTADWLLETRRRAHVLKTARQGAGAPTGAPFSDVWKRYTAVVEKWSDKTRTNYDTRMKRYVGPARMWSLPIGAVSVFDVEDAVAEARKARPLLAPRLLLDIRAAFTWAIARGEATGNPAASYLASLRHIEKRPKPNKLPALVEIKALRKVLATIETSNLFGSLRHAFLLQSYTAQRSGSVVSARWQDINLKARTWTIPRADMKQDDVERGDMVVPLNRPAVALLAKLPKNGSPWMFPAPSQP